MKTIPHHCQGPSCKSQCDFHINLMWMLQRRTPASDYDLVLANFKMKLKAGYCSKTIPSVFVLTWINLRSQKLSQVFQTQIGGKFAALNLIDREIDTVANDIK